MRNAKGMTLCALFAALTAVCSQIQIPLQPVAISLALLAVHLSAALLPPGQAAAAMTVYVLMGAVGLPVFSGFSGGLGVLLNHTGGYIVGYVLSAMVSGLMIRRTGRSLPALCLAFAAGTLACYAFGTAWFALKSATPLWASLSVCVLPFLPGDAAKILVAALMARRLEAPLKRMMQ